jgi:arabinose-5-phosphate isomerase
MADVMSANPKTINGEILAAQALKIMEDSTITALIVEDENHHPIGVLHMHDILRAGVV